MNVREKFSETGLFETINSIHPLKYMTIIKPKSMDILYLANNGCRKLSYLGENNTVEEKSFLFAIRIVNLSKYLVDKNEYVLSKQVLRSGTSIGANIAEAQQAQSRADFISKLSIALKEASETNYWLRLLAATNYLSQKGANSMLADCKELEKLLTAILNSAKD